MEYFIKKENNEHMLFIGEIAAMYGIYSINENLHTKLIKALLEEEIKEQKDYIQYYFNCRKGLVPVYPYYIYSNTIKKINNNLNEIVINNKKFKYKVIK